MNTEAVDAVPRDALAIIRHATGKVLKAFGRALVVVLVILVAILIGIAVPILARDWIAAMPPAGLAFGASALLGVARGLFESLPTAWDFIVKAVAESLPKIFAQVAVAALGLGFAYYATAPADKPGRSLNLSVSGSLPPVMMYESDALLTAYVVFDDWKAELPEGDAQIKLVNNLVDSLATCLHSPSDGVDLQIRAYASSYGPDDINEKLFKDRGQYVRGLIAKRLEIQPAAIQAQFQVDVREWKNLQLMKIRRLFKDTDDAGVYLKEAGALNRRAEIKVRSAGACLPT